MVIFSVCGRDDGEGPSNNRQLRKRQRLSSIDEDEEDAENSDDGSSDEEERGMESDDRRSTRNREEVIEERRSRKSGNSEGSSSSKDSRISITLTDPEVLECPICCEPLTIPIFQCDNGHLACSLCCTKARNKCGSCSFPIGYIRNRAMENVIEACRVSCPNGKYGCKENTSYGNRLNHEKWCVFTPCSCPILNCNYTGYYKDLNNHVRAEHKNDLIPFVWDKCLPLDLNENTTILQEQNDGYVVVVQVFTALNVVNVSVSCIAPAQGKFSCSLELLTGNGSLKQHFRVKNIQKLRNEQPSNGFMSIPSYMLCGNESEKLLISISRGMVLMDE